MKLHSKPGPAGAGPARSDHPESQREEDQSSGRGRVAIPGEAVKRGELYRVFRRPGSDPKRSRVFVVVSLSFANHLATTLRDKLLEVVAAPGPFNTVTFTVRSP